MVCVVDDDASVRKSLTNLLKSVGYRTVSFASGEAFLGSREVNEAACVLLDLRMEGLQGLQVQHCLKRGGKTVAVICMSAHQDPACIDEAYAAGALDFLHKPFNEDILLAAIERALAGGCP
nr:response regulator [Pseudomonas sp. dw_358]